MLDITTPEIIQYSAIVIIVIFLIREMFSYLKAKKSCDNNKTYQSNGLWKTDIANINLKLDNHITTIGKSVSAIETDIKLMQKDIRDILIRLTIGENKKNKIRR